MPLPQHARTLQRSHDLEGETCRALNLRSQRTRVRTQTLCRTHPQVQVSEAENKALQGRQKPQVSTFLGSIRGRSSSAPKGGGTNTTSSRSSGDGKPSTSATRLLTQTLPHFVTLGFLHRNTTDGRFPRHGEINNYAARKTGPEAVQTPFVVPEAGDGADFIGGEQHQFHLNALLGFCMVSVARDFPGASHAQLPTREGLRAAIMR